MPFLAKERVDKDKQIKKRQRTVLADAQKQRKELQTKLDEVTKEQQTGTIAATMATTKVDQAVQASQQTEEVVSKPIIETVNNNTNEEFEKMKKELDELRDRNNDLEEYYEVNTKRTDNAHKILTDYEKLKETVKELQVELVSARQQPMKIEKPSQVVSKEPMNEEDKDHLCYSGGCDDLPKNQDTQKPSNLDAIIQS